jgi:hypothetical protein
VTADWVTAISTAVLAVGGIVAGVYAVRTYRAQHAELELARRDSKRQRTPVLQGELSVEPGKTTFRLDAWLSTSEPLSGLRLVIDEARANDCPLGFSIGQTGVETYVDFEALPAGWRNDPVRPEARWTQTLLPGSAATFEMRLRRQPGERADPGKIRVRAECTPIEGGEPWIVNVPVTVTPSAADKLPHGRVQTTRPPSQIPELGSPHLDLPGTRG